MSHRGVPPCEARTSSGSSSLAIPPAWRDVWICPDPRGHLQATGRDARGTQAASLSSALARGRDEAKYDRILEFAAALPAIAQARRSRPRRSTDCRARKVVAAVVQLLEKTLIRVGNDEYARDNQSFGLTTHARRPRADHRDRRFAFGSRASPASSTTSRSATRGSRASSGGARSCPGRELFQYLDDDGKVQDIGSADVNDYLREVTGRDFTAKDFRTWTGTVLAAQGAAGDEGVRVERRRPSATCSRPSRPWPAMLGNTRSVCRKCYVHPGDHRCLHGSHARADAERARRSAARPGVTSLSRTETAVLALLQRRLRREAQRKSA